MCCKCYEKDFDFEPENDDVVVNAGGAARAVLMEISDALIDLCNWLEVGEIKINVSQECESGNTVFKAKVDGKKVLEVKANDFVSYLSD